MDEFHKTFLRAAVSEYDKLSELEKQTGVETRVLARVLSSALGIDESSIDSPGFQGSEPFIRVMNTVRDLREAGHLKQLGHGPVYWVTPTESGGALVETWKKQERTPVLIGRRLVEYLYGLHETSGSSRFDKLCESLGMDARTRDRAVEWASRKGYVERTRSRILATKKLSADEKQIWITNKGRDAVDDDFKTEEVPSGQTIIITNSQVYGSVLAAGVEALVVPSPELSASAVEIRQLLREIQEAIDTLEEDDDDRHDALQEAGKLQREFSKESPTPGRIERSLSAIGSVASIGALAGPQLARLLELAQQLPGM